MSEPTFRDFDPERDRGALIDLITGEEWTRQGVYLRVRARFDETLFDGGAK